MQDHHPVLRNLENQVLVQVQNLNRLLLLSTALKLVQNLLLLLAQFMNHKVHTLGHGILGLMPGRKA